MGFSWPAGWKEMVRGEPSPIPRYLDRWVSPTLYLSKPCPPNAFPLHRQNCSHFLRQQDSNRWNAPRWANTPCDPA
jgi:hypothetical protein